MPDSPIAATPYEVLGVSSSASTEELRKAYRRMLREAHPDTGGSEARFHAVQRAWDSARRKQANDEAYQKLRAHYSIEIQKTAPGAAAAASPSPTTTAPEGTKK